MADICVLFENSIFYHTGGVVSDVLFKVYILIILLLWMWCIDKYYIHIIH